MKYKINFIFIVISLFLAFYACDKTDDNGGDFPSSGTVKDTDGNKYNTVKIGTQVWMVDNLKTTKYNDGKAIPNVTDNSEWGNLTKGAYCNFDNLESNAKIAGRLYNWYAVNTGKLAPKGWHVPSEDDWTIMKKYLINNGYNYDGSKNENLIAKALSSKTGWGASTWPGSIGLNPEENNSTGFTALPTGYRDIDGEFYYFETRTNWWCSTECEDGAYIWGFGSSYDYLGSGCINKEWGCSVRLIKD